MKTKGDTAETAALELEKVADKIRRGELQGVLVLAVDAKDTFRVRGFALPNFDTANYLGMCIQALNQLWHDTE